MQSKTKLRVLTWLMKMKVRVNVPVCPFHTSSHNKVWYTVPEWRTVCEQSKKSMSRCMQIWWSVKCKKNNPSQKRSCRKYKKKCSDTIAETVVITTRLLTVMAMSTKGNNNNNNSNIVKTEKKKMMRMILSLNALIHYDFQSNRIIFQLLHVMYDEWV